MVAEIALLVWTWGTSCWLSWMIGFHQGMKERSDGE